MKHKGATGTLKTKIMAVTVIMVLLCGLIMGGASFMLGKSAVENAVGAAVETMEAEGNGFNSTALEEKVLDEYAAKSTMILAVTLGIAVVLTVIGAGIAAGVGNSISRPLTECTERIRLFAKGDLKTAVPVVNTNDEIEALAQSMKEMQTIVDGMTSDLDFCLSNMAVGYYAFKSSGAHFYVGDFENLLTLIRDLEQHLHSTIGSIQSSAGSIAGGAQHVADSAQNLSQGTTQQASAIEELAASINEISNQIQETAANANAARAQVDSVGNKLLESNADMKHLVTAMDDIKSSSDEIGKIIKTIEDIAFQTNILALNAAVEAARAGAAGKGFAVVADEVRNLANKSQEASKNTAALIERSLKAVENGTRIAGETESSLETVVEGTSTIIDLVAKISDAANNQANAVNQVTIGIDQISSVTQTNSASAEEEAAASEELTSQVNEIRQQLSQFQFQDDNVYTNRDISGLMD